MPTLQDVARTAGVSRSTVSLVLRGSPLVADATRERVLEAIEACRYVYNRSAANLRAARTHTVGLVVSDITNPFYAELMAGAEGVLEEAGQVVFIAHTEESDARQQRFLRRMLEHRVDGVILSAAGGTRPQALEAFTAAETPIVQVLRSVDERRFDYVSGDDRLGTRVATEHLIARGHCRIAYLGTSIESSVSIDRFAGFADAMASQRLSLDPELARTCLPRWAEAKQATAQMLALRPPPTALVCFNDLLALAAMLAIAETGREPGRDVAVVGFDDIDLAAAWRPRLTTVSIPAREVGREAGRTLLERIAGSAKRPQRVLLAPRLIVRESCGAGAP